MGGIGGDKGMGGGGGEGLGVGGGWSNRHDPSVATLIWSIETEVPDFFHHLGRQSPKRRKTSLQDLFFFEAVPTQINFIRSGWIKQSIHVF